MSKYRVYFTRVDMTSVDVEAEDKDEAIDKAYDQAMLPGLCIQCTGWGRDYYVDPGEWEVADEDNDVELLEDDD